MIKNFCLITEHQDTERLQRMRFVYLVLATITLLNVMSSAVHTSPSGIFAAEISSVYQTNPGHFFYSHTFHISITLRKVHTQTPHIFLCTPKHPHNTILTIIFKSNNAYKNHRTNLTQTFYYKKRALPE